MKIALIVAMARNRVIGHKNTLPWHLPADLLHFKQLTMGHAIIMGRKTFESIGKALPGRQNIVISRNAHFAATEVTTASSLEHALQQVAHKDANIFIIGGAEIYKMALPIADRLYITEVDAAPTGDTFFPELDSDQWSEVRRDSHRADEKNQHGYEFVIYDRL